MNVFRPKYKSTFINTTGHVGIFPSFYNALGIIAYIIKYDCIDCIAHVVRATINLSLYEDECQVHKQEVSVWSELCWVN